MRLLEKVTQLRFEGSSDDDDDDAVDDAWQPGNSRDGSDADEAPVVERLTSAQAEHASRHLTHVDLANALQRLATTSAPRRVAPEELTQVQPPLSLRCTCAADVRLRTGLVATGLPTPCWCRPALAWRKRLACGCRPAWTVTRTQPLSFCHGYSGRSAPTRWSRSSMLRHSPSESRCPWVRRHVFHHLCVCSYACSPAAEFVAYFTTIPRRSLLNVVSLSLAGTPLENTLCAPRVVREADLVARAWPATRQDCPAVQLYALASPAGCVTDWHLDFGGSSVWYSIISGSKVFALAPPTTNNLRAFVHWASSSRQSRQFLGDALEDVHKYTVRAGELLLIPGGWPHAVYTPEDSLVVGGNFVHAANLGLQCLVWRIEDRLSVEASFRYPNFKALCWYAARSFMNSLPPAPGEDAAVAKAERLASKRLLVKLREEGAAAPPDATGASASPAGHLHYILNALKAEEEGGGGGALKTEEEVRGDTEAVRAGEQAAAPSTAGANAETAAASAIDDIVLPHVAAEADHETAVTAAGEPPSADKADDVGGEGAGIPSTDEAAVASALLGGADAAEPSDDKPEPSASAIEAQPLTATEKLELVKLSAQLNTWLEQSGRDADPLADVPADIEKPRSVFVRLQTRLRAAGFEVASIVDSFQDAAEDITRGGTRMRFRVRTRNVPAPGDEELQELQALPFIDDDEGEEEDDEDEGEPRKARPKAKAASAKPAKEAAKPIKRAAPAASVRDRLAKKLKLSKRR